MTRNDTTDQIRSKKKNWKRKDNKRPFSRRWEWWLRLTTSHTTGKARQGTRWRSIDMHEVKLLDLARGEYFQTDSVSSGMLRLKCTHTRKLKRKRKKWKKISSISGFHRRSAIKPVGECADYEFKRTPVIGLEEKRANSWERRNFVIGVLKGFGSPTVLLRR